MLESEPESSGKLVSVTRVELDTVDNKLTNHLREALQQSRVTPGLLEPPRIWRRGNVFYVLTIWESFEDMMRYRNSGAHLTAMHEAPALGKTEYLRWYANQIPQREEVLRRIEEFERK